VIRTNLSTRPFYNERAVHTWLAFAAILIAIATVFNITRVLRYSSSDTRLGSQASHAEARAADVRAQAAQLRRTVDPRQIDLASTEARQANDLIDRRTFSWTELFNKFESTLPDEVRITSVRPHIEKRGIVLTIAVVARGVGDIDTFMKQLKATGAFPSLRPVEERENDQGLLESTLEAIYEPAAPPAAQASQR